MGDEIEIFDQALASGSVTATAKPVPVTPATGIQAAVISLCLQASTRVGPERARATLCGGLHTQPPIAAAGWTEVEAHVAGHDVEAISETLPLVADDDGTMVEQDRNLIKLVAQSSTGLILGCQAIGSRAPELINLASSAIRTGLTVQRLADLSLIHPSASEALIRLLQERFDRVAQH